MIDRLVYLLMQLKKNLNLHVLQIGKCLENCVWLNIDEVQT